MLFCLVFLGSCGIYNKYERPEVKTDGLFRDTADLNRSLASTDTFSLGSIEEQY